MSEAIKLFGRRIAIPENHVADEVGDRSDSGPAVKQSVREEEKVPCQETIAVEVKDLAADNPEEFDCNDLDGTSGMNNTKDENDKEALLDDKLTADLKPEPEQAEQKVSSQEKVLKKPDKILPCPRCNSLDTKFCYYNNYNVNQPRHFCKNCQRYWTAGGTMRNVPVGAGRRKNKHSSSHFHQMMTASEGMPSLQIDVPDSPYCHSARQFCGNRTVKFGQETQICDTMTNSLNLGEQRQGEISPTTRSEIGKDLTCSSSLVIPSSLDKESLENADHIKQNALLDPCGGMIPMHSLHCYPGPPWAFHWSPGWNDIAATAAAGRSISTVVNEQENSNPNPMPWSLSPMIAAPAFVPPMIPVPLVPASFWGCMASWPAGAWNIPLNESNGCQLLSSSIENNDCPGIHSHRLGKHSRDSILQMEEKVEKSLWVPKTLRIDDPEEAAKSSIWATLGIKHDRNEPHVKGGIFKSFQPKADEQSLQPDATQVMRANPAALSRSRTFQEST